MKKPLCITTFVFGAEYQEYIPLFVYSILRAYPEYYPLVFVQGRVADGVRRRLDLLRPLGPFRVVEDYLAQLGWTGGRARAVRWLAYHPDFTEHEAVYAGDIDMLMMPEQPKLHEQHNIHCRVLGLPYSNILRPAQVSRMRKDPVSLAKSLLRFGPRAAAWSLAHSEIRMDRLSGLHYVRADEYFPAVLPKMLEFMGMLGAGCGSEVLQAGMYMDGCLDEGLLLDLVRSSGLGLPPEVEYGPHLLDYKNYNLPGFRPHHGIHLGIFRKTEFNPADSVILRLPCYREYYAHYKREIKPEPLFQALLAASPQWLQAMFTRLERGCETATAAA